MNLCSYEQPGWPLALYFLQKHIYTTCAQAKFVRIYLIDQIMDQGKRERYGSPPNLQIMVQDENCYNRLRVVVDYYFFVITKKEKAAYIRPSKLRLIGSLR